MTRNEMIENITDTINEGLPDHCKYWFKEVKMIDFTDDSKLRIIGEVMQEIKDEDGRIDWAVTMKEVEVTINKSGVVDEFVRYIVWRLEIDECWYDVKWSEPQMVFFIDWKAHGKDYTATVKIREEGFDIIRMEGEEYSRIFAVMSKVIDSIEG